MRRFTGPPELGPCASIRPPPVGAHMTGSVLVHNGGLRCMSD